MYTKVILDDLDLLIGGKLKMSDKGKSESGNNNYQINLYKEIFAKECVAKARVKRDETVWSKSKQEQIMLRNLRKQHRHSELKTLLSWSN